MRIGGIFFTIFCLGTLSLKAQIQEVKFSQFFNFPLYIHPSESGNIEEDYRIAGIYRQQWNSIASEFTTFGASGDMKFNKGFLPGDFFGVGIYALNDHLGQNIMQTQELGLTLAYHHPLDFQGRHIVSVGTGFNYAMSNVNIDQLIFESQYNGFTPDMTIPNGEPFTADQIANYDLGAGLSYSFLINKKVETSVSASWLNIIKPQETFFSDSIVTENINRKIISGKVKYNISQRVALVPTWLMSLQQKATEVSTGVILEYDLLPHNAFQVDFGVLGQWSEYIMLYGGAVINGVEVHASYDVSMSGLADLASTDGLDRGRPGVFEISLIFKGLTKSNTNSYTIPCRWF